MKKTITTIIGLMKQAVAASRKLNHVPSAWSRVLDEHGTTWVSACAVCNQALLIGTTLDPQVQDTATAHECPSVPTTQAVALAEK